MNKISLLFIGIILLSFISVISVSALSIVVYVPEKYTDVVAGERLYSLLIPRPLVAVGRFILRLRLNILKIQRERI